MFFGIARALFFQRWAMIQMSPSGGQSGLLPSLFSSVRSRNSQPFLLSFNCFFRSSSSLCLPRANPRAGITKTKLRDRERIGSWSVPNSFYFLSVKTDILHNSHRSSSRWELHWWELSMSASRWASMATKDLPIQLNGNIPSCLLFLPQINNRYICACQSIWSAQIQEQIIEVSGLYIDRHIYYA